MIHDTLKTEIKEEQTAEYINFCINIGPILATKFNRPWRFTGTMNDNHLESITTNMDAITQLCKNININKASCIDNISSEVLRYGFLAVPNKIVNMFNLSFKTGEIPDVWKIGKVTPLQKVGNKSSVIIL